jgi:hypothetical protein
MALTSKEGIKNLLGQIPFTAELYWLMRQGGGPIKSRFSLKHLQEQLPGLVTQAQFLRQKTKPGKNIFIFATLHYWIEHASLLGISLASLGHRVTLGYLPYGEWEKPINRFDLRRQNAYARKVLRGAEPLINSISFLNSTSANFPLPDALKHAIDQVTMYDTQYTLQIEDVDPASAIYQMRKERNTDVALTVYPWLRVNRPDVVIVPNGTVQELGVVYRIARILDIPTTTYEFGDQRQRMWVAQNEEVMRQGTDDLWKARNEKKLTEAQLDRLKSLIIARQRASIWENFARQWQDTPAQGGEQARQALGLDQRPLVLLATNVLGDSLTLGRQVFSRSMSEWISRTVQYFAGRPDVQLVIRIHPGEVLTHGLSMVDVVKSVLPTMPEHIRLIKPKDKVNTYDLIEVADLGLVYTTTVGLEMAMSSVPVIVTGQTHYRGRGFTHDPDSWVNYFKMLGQIIEHPENFHMKREQTELAWQYAYRFFFEFPRPFPWHLVRMWEDYKSRPIQDVFNDEGMAQYGSTFNYLAGDPIQWNQIED